MRFVDFFFFFLFFILIFYDFIFGMIFFSFGRGLEGVISNFGSLGLSQYFRVIFLLVILILIKLCFDYLALKSINWSYFIIEAKPFLRKNGYKIMHCKILFYFSFFFSCTSLIEMARCLLGGSDRVRAAAEWCNRIGVVSYR